MQVIIIEWWIINLMKISCFCARSLEINQSLHPIYTPHYGAVIMGAIASQITSLTIVYSTVYSDADQRKHQNSASLAFVWGIHRGPVNSPHKWPVTRKMLPFDDVIMACFNPGQVSVGTAVGGGPPQHEIDNPVTWGCFYNPLTSDD